MYDICLCSTAIMAKMYGGNGDFCSIKYRPDVVYKFYNKNFICYKCCIYYVHSQTLLTHRTLSLTT